MLHRGGILDFVVGTRNLPRLTAGVSYDDRTDHACRFRAGLAINCSPA